MKIVMTKKIRNTIIAGLVMLGLVSVLFLIPISFSSSSIAVEDSEAAEAAFQERLLEYAEFGLFYDEESGFFYLNEQRVRRLVDAPSLFQYGNGIVEVTISRDRDGNIIDFMSF